MERPGICAVCAGAAQPAYSCRMCGALVCSSHFDAEKGLCTRCAGKLGRTAID